MGEDETPARPAADSRALDHAVFFAWAGLLAVLTWQHVPWRDELQTWLVATRTPDLVTFFEAIRYERQPPFLYLLQRLVAVVPGPLDPLLATRLTTVPFVLGFGWLLICRAEWLPRALRWLLPFTLPLLRDYGVLSRAYAPGLCFLLLAALAFRAGHEGRGRVWLALSACSHAAFTLLALGVLALRWRELLRRPLGRRLALATALAAVLFAIALLSQVPPADSAFPTRPNFDLDLIGHALRALAIAFGGFERVGPAHGLVALLGLLALWRWAAFPIARYAVLCLPLLVVIASYPNMSVRHTGLLLVALAWLAFSEWTAPPAAALTLALPLLGTAGWLSAWRPLPPPAAADHSGSGELLTSMSDALDPAHTVLVSGRHYLFLAAHARRPLALYDIDQAAFVDYPRFRALPDPSLGRWCQAYGPVASTLFDGRRIVLGLRRGEPLPRSCSCASLIFRNQRPVITDEAFDLWLWRPGRCRKGVA